MALQDLPTIEVFTYSSPNGLESQSAPVSPFTGWGHLDTDFLKVAEQTQRKARTEFQSPERWESRGQLRLLRRSYEPLLLPILYPVPHSCTHDSSIAADVAAVRFLPDQYLKDTLIRAPDE